ncbi:MAG TPA: BTAD domain-containing putative transcriptional regulator, partial [Actinomycetota bacterium]|nr:BTAD domain-containing putative transcriptional regulator [Actinomycetota bacterium]
ACLLLHPGETVSIDRLTDELWGSQPPEHADRNLHQYAFRLRRILDDHGRVVLITRAPGYRLELGEEDLLDATLFERCVRQARDSLADRPAEALELLERGLTMWRGPALADFAYEGFAEASARRLEELRVSAEETRVEALLALRRDRDAIAEAESLVQRFPLREHVRALLMLALYRAGRQAEALAAYQAARQALAAELGIDPGPELRSLSEAILRHDPALLLPTPVEPAEIPPDAISPPAGEPSGDTSVDHADRGPRYRRRRPGLLVGGTLVLVVLVTLIALAARPDEPAPPTSPSGRTRGPSIEELRLDWQEASYGDFVGPGDQRILGGVETSTGFLVFGHTTKGRPNAAGKPDFDTAVWEGDPGQQWEAVRSRSFVGMGNQRATDAVIFGAGAIVLLGSSETPTDFDAAAWIHPAGAESSEWMPADVLAEDLHRERDQRIRDAVQVGARLLVAVGSTGGALEADAALWVSEGGRRWTYQDGAVDRERGVEEMTGVVRSPEGLLVMGGFVDGPEDQEAAIWTAETPAVVDRIEDPDLGGPGDQQINAIVVGGPGFVAVGEEDIDGDIDPVVWTSTDGEEWDRVADPANAFVGVGEQHMYAVARSVDPDVGLVAAGTDVLPPDADVSEPEGHWDAAVWTSIDGEHWIRLPGDDPSMSSLADQGRQEIKAVLPIEGGFLALGAEGESGSNWDGRVWIGELAT